VACAGGGEDVAYWTGGSAFLFEELLLGFVGVVTRCGGFGFGCRGGFGGFDKLVHGVERQVGDYCVVVERFIVTGSLIWRGVGCDITRQLRHAARTRRSINHADPR
jgi:hypothetical protein